MNPEELQGMARKYRELRGVTVNLEELLGMVFWGMTRSYSQF